jgi:hypothetical protein
LEEENAEEPKEDDSMELQDDTVPHEDEIPIRSSEKVSGNKKHSQDESERASGERIDEGGDVEMCVEVDGDKVETLGAARGSETMFHTMPGELMADTSQQDLMSPEDYHAMRSQLESQLATWSQVSIMDGLNEQFVDTDSFYLKIGRCQGFYSVMQYKD